MSADSEHPAESVTAVAGEGGVAVSYVAAGSRVSPMAVVLLAASALIFSTGGLFIRKLDHPQAWQTVFWRSLSACVSLSLLIIWRERANPLRAVVKIGRPGWTVASAFCVSSIGMVVALVEDKRCNRPGDLRTEPAGRRRDGVVADPRARAQLHMDRDRRHRCRCRVHGVRARRRRLDIRRTRSRCRFRLPLASGP